MSPGPLNRARMLLPALLTAVLLSVFASPALAANQAVNVGDLFFSPPRVAVKPGETVTWTMTGSAPHNVAFEDAVLIDPPTPQFGPWTTTRTFTTEGSYRYYCQLHGGFGGQGMAGIVDVNAAGNVAPVAGFTATPSPVQPGQLVSFQATGSGDADGTIAQFEWDLDGNGSYETNTGPTPTTSRSYPTSATILVKLRVTDNLGATAEATVSVLVNVLPTASFAVSPNPAQAGGTVTFDGSGSADPDGTIAKYEWDFDSNGLYESNTGATPTASHAYASPGPVTAKLRVTDNVGATAVTTRSIQVNRPPAVAPPLVPPLPMAPSAPQQPSFADSKQSITVGRTGRFKYSFRAGAGLTGSIDLGSIAKVRVSAKRKISLGTKRFTVPSSGIVTLSWKLSRKNLAILKRNARIKFRATASLRDGAGATSSGSTGLTLRRPKRE